MIIEVIFTMFTALVTTVFGILPSLPPMPEVIVSGMDWLLQNLMRGVQILTYFLSNELYLAILICAPALLFFEQFYHTVMFILKKIPFLGIK